MSKYYSFITPENSFLIKPQDADRVFYAELNEYYYADSFRSFGIKCVFENRIHYNLGITQHEVKANSYMVSVKQPGVKVCIDAKKGTARSVCIDFSPKTAGEVFTLLTTKKEPAMDNYLSGYFKYPEFLETVAPLDNSKTGLQLRSLENLIKRNKHQVTITKEWLYEMMESIVFQEYKKYIALASISSLKTSTRKEIFNRISRGKEFMDDAFLEIRSISEIAASCHMSEYHFFRSFKQVHSITPYQYLLQKRVHFSAALLREHRLSLAEISRVCGFSDVPTYSKAFKRNFGMSPKFFLSAVGPL